MSKNRQAKSMLSPKPESQEELGADLPFAEGVSDPALEINSPLEESLLAPDSVEPENGTESEGEEGEPDAYTEKMLLDIEAELEQLEQQGEQQGMFGDEIQVQSRRAIFTCRDLLRTCFAHFRAKGFPFWKVPIHIGMQELNELIKMDDDALRHTSLGYHVADTYHPHRFEAKIKGKYTPLASFENDVRLKLALALLLKNGVKLGVNMPSTLNMVRGTQTASNFRPGFALYLYRKYLPSCEGVVLDTSTGYGGRLTAALCLPKVRYIGVDPNTPTYEGNLRLAKDYGASERVTLLHQPIEDVDVGPFYELCDLAFTSPPYFSKERYSEEPTQNWMRYTTAESWREGFLRPMLLAQFAMLKPGATNIVNIADVNIGSKRIPLSSWTREEAERCGFEALDDLLFPLSSRFGGYQVVDVATEPVLVFRKPME